MRKSLPRRGTKAFEKWKAEADATWDSYQTAKMRQVDKANYSMGLTDEKPEDDTYPDRYKD